MQDEKRIYYGGAIKAVGDGKVEGTLIAFTDDTIKDLHGEYFTAKTNLHTESYPIGDGLRVLYQHGLDETYGIKSVGQVVKAKIDDIGVWVQAQLDLADDYQRMIYEMAESGKLGWSSGALPQSVKVADDGHIEEWAVIEASLTPNPAMPFATRIQTAKSLLESIQTPSGVKGANQEHKEHSGDNVEPGAVKRDATLSTDNDNNEVNKMTPEEIRELVRLIIEEYRAGMSEGEKMDEEEIADEIVEAVAMDGEVLDEEELAKSVAEKALSILNAKVESRRKAHNVALDMVRKNAPSNAPKMPAKHHISVSENLKYAHLSAEEMALGYQALRSAIPEALRRSVSPVSDEYMRHLSAKASEQLNRGGFKDVRDNVAVKSVMPFKADEFDATNIAGQGQEWVGVFYGTTLWEKARNENALFRMLSEKGMFQQEIPQGAGSVKIPTEGSDPIAYSSPEANDLDATNRPEVTANIGYFGTGNVTLTPGQIKIAAAATDELVEDSVIAVLPNMARQMQIKAIETLEQAILNGDKETAANTNINLIDGTPGTGISRPYYLAVNGLRKYPLVTNTAYASNGGGDAPALADYRALLALFSPEVQTRIDQMLFVMDVYTANASMAISEIATNDVNRQYTVENGVLPKIYGVQTHASGYLLKSNTAGKIPNAGGTLGQLLLVYAPYWAFGWKREVTFETQRDILSGTNIAVASMRFGFEARGADASAIQYNILV